MRILWVVLLLAISAPALAETPPDLVLTWQEGEQSRDSSMWTTRITLTGTKLHYARTYQGRNSGMPNTKPTELDATVKDPKKVAAALATFDKTKASPVKKSKDPTRYRLRSGCIRRGKVERCVEVWGDDPDPADLRAIAAVRDALIEGVKLPRALSPW